MLGQGGMTAEACRRIAVSEQTYYRWRKEYGGLKTDQARRIKDLEKENLRLRRAISDLTLDKLILRRPPGDTSEPRTASTLHRPSEGCAGRIRGEPPHRKRSFCATGSNDANASETRHKITQDMTT